MYVGSRRGDASEARADISSLPAPTDPTVRLNVAGGEVMAVLRFDGYITPQTAEEMRARLVAALQQGAWPGLGSIRTRCVFSSIPTAFNSHLTHPGPVLLKCRWAGAGAGGPAGAVPGGAVWRGVHAGAAR